MLDRLKRKLTWKMLLNIITLLALVILIIVLRNDLGDTLNNLKKVNGWALLLIIPVEIVNYHAQSKLYQRLFAVVGNKLSYKELFKASLELNFVNHVFPSGGVTGISYFGLRFRKHQAISGGKATLIHVMKLMLTFLSFELLLVVGVIALAVMGRVNSLTILVAGSLSTLLLVGTLGFAYIVGSKARINQFFTGVTKVLNRIIQLVRPHHPETINIGNAKTVFEDFHQNYKQLRQNSGQLKGPFWWAFVANLTEVLAIYVVFIAFGHPVNIGAVILAYAVANFAGLISVLPGGVGVYEFLMTAVLATAGVSAGISLPVIVMYRVVNTVIQLPPGYILYQQYLKRGGQAMGKQQHESVSSG